MVVCVTLSFCYSSKMRNIYGSTAKSESIKCVCVWLRCAVSVREFVIQHHRNAAQLVPVVRVYTAGFHGHREEGG